MAAQPQRIILVGASAGGLDPLKLVIAGLDATLAAAVMVVLHISPVARSELPAILTRAGRLKAHHAVDGEPIESGAIYVAPPDHHLLVEGRRVHVSKGPRENRFRPSIDAMFRSAAYTVGPHSIGVLLSGALDDGTSGLWSIKHRGGIAIVQNPNEALFDPMPRTAMKHVRVDHAVPAAQIAPLLMRLVAASAPEAPPTSDEEDRRMRVETRIAARGGALESGVLDLGEYTPLTCPECHGSLVMIREPSGDRFRCHTGHAFSASKLLEATTEVTGELIAEVLKGYEEALILIEHMGRDLHKAGQEEGALAYEAKAEELRRRSKEFTEAMMRHEILSDQNIGAERREADVPRQAAKRSASS